MATKEKAKKAKAKAAKKSNSAERVSAAAYKSMASGIGKGKVPETVGEHFRARIVEGRLDNEAILKEVKAKHKGCKAAMSSLYWNRQYLAHHDGIALPKAAAAKE